MEPWVVNMIRMERASVNECVVDVVVDRFHYIEEAHTDILTFCKAVWSSC